MATKTIAEFKRPFSSLLLNETELMVADFVAKSIFVVNLKSGSRYVLETPFEILGPHCLTYSLDQKWIYITDYVGKKILKYSSDLKFDSIFLEFKEGSWLLSGPATTRIDPFGLIYVSDYGSNSIQKFSGDGSFLGWLGASDIGSGAWIQGRIPQVSTSSGGFDRVHDLVFDASHNFYVADTWNKRIQKFSYNGTWLFEFSEGFVLPVAIDRWHDYLAVSDVGNHSVRIFNLNGKCLKTLTGFNKPYDIRWNEGFLCVSDSDNQRIQMIPTEEALA